MTICRWADGPDIATATADLERLDDTIRRAQETIDRAIKERQEIAIFLRLHERYAVGGSAPVLGRGAMSSKAEIVRSESREIILAHGRRMPIQRIFDDLVAKGIEIAGDQPKANLAGILSRDKDHFEYRKPEGWWLVGVPEPDEGRATRARH